MKHGNVSFTVKEGQIGPHHDPYSTMKITVHAANGDSGTYYCNGLGAHRVQFFSDTNGSRPVRTIEWNLVTESDRRAHRQNELKANIIARRTLGARFDELEQVWHSTPDLSPTIHM